MTVKNHSSQTQTRYKSLRLFDMRYRYKEANFSWKRLWRQKDTESFFLLKEYIDKFSTKVNAYTIIKECNYLTNVPF